MLTKRFVVTFCTVFFLQGLMVSCTQEASKQEISSEIPMETLAPEDADGKFPYKRLSTYDFFTGEMAKLSPN